MFHRKRKQARRRWLLAGFAPLVAGAVWVIREAILRRSQGGRRFSSMPRAYNLEQPPGERRIAGLRVATMDPGEEFAETPLEEEAGDLPQAGIREQSRMVVGQVPVTAKNKPASGKQGGAQSRRAGGARLYETAAAQGPSTPRAMRFDEGRKAPFPWLLALIPLLILGVVIFMGLLGRNPARAQVMAVPGGNPENGRQAIQSWGCGSCHTISGVPGALGKVGPKLEGLSERTYIAGILPNTPDNMIQWIMNPQEIQPGNAMPDTDVPAPTARDMAAYLYSLK